MNKKTLLLRMFIALLLISVMITSTTLFARSDSFKTVLIKIGLVQSDFASTIFATVDELQPLSLLKLSSRLGVGFFIFSLIIIVHLVYEQVKKVNATEIFLIVWYSCTLIFSFSAERLLMFFILPYFIIIGLGLSKILKYLNQKVFRDIELPYLNKLYKRFINRWV